MRSKLPDIADDSADNVEPTVTKILKKLPENADDSDVAKALSPYLTAQQIYKAKMNAAAIKKAQQIPQQTLTAPATVQTQNSTAANNNQVPVQQPFQTQQAPQAQSAQAQPAQSDAQTQPQTTDAPVEHKSLAKKIGSLFDPGKAALDAEKNNHRWQYALEHTALFDNENYANTVMRGAQIEKALDAANQEKDQARATEMQRRTMASQYNSLISDYEHNYWNSSPDDRQQVLDAAQRMRDNYAAAGFNADDLKPVPTQAGGLSAQNSQLTKYEDYIDTTEYLGNMMQQEIQTGKPITQNALDKVSQRIASALGGDASSMADAEKVRIQLQFLPAADKAVVMRTMQNYRNALTRIMASDSSKAWSQNWRNKVYDVAADFDKGNYADFVGGMTALVKSGQTELPQNAEGVFEAAKEQYDSNIKQLTMAAQIDQLALYNIAKYLHDQSEYSYNDIASHRGLRQKYTSQMPDIDPKVLLSMNMQNNPMITTPKFVTPSLAPNPQIKVNANPTLEPHHNTAGGFGKAVGSFY